MAECIVAIHCLVIELVIYVLRLLVPFLSEQLLVVVVHVVHVVHARVMLYPEAGIESGELHQFVCHRQDAPYHHRTLGIHPHVALEHLGKSLIHPSGYLPVLFGSERGELAISVGSLISDDFISFHHVLAQWCEHSRTVGTFQHLVWIVVVLGVDEVSRPVPAVVTDVERFVILGCRGQFARRRGVSHLVAGRITYVAF